MHSNQMNEIDISKLIKASDVFERFRIGMVTDRDQAGAVQAFEFCYELAWKIMKRFLEAQGFECGSPKDTYRKAALEKIIDDPELWFEFQRKRNLTVHTYEQENLDLIVSIFDAFSTEIHRLIQKLQELQSCT